MDRLIARIGLSFLALSFLTCIQFSAAQQPQLEQRTGPSGQQQPLSQRDLQRITQEVRHQLVMLPYYNLFDSLKYSVAPDGTVTLMGQVTRPTLKSDAQNAVKHIEGVDRVNNEIEVLPVSPMDDSIRRAEFRAIYGYPGMERYAIQSVPPIHIVVKNGNVTLDGVVATEADKNMVGIRANSVPNVFHVTNNLQVENQGSSQGK